MANQNLDAQETQGNFPHGTTDAGNPVKVGGKARTANPTAVGDADRVDAFFDDVGRQVVYPYQVRDLTTTAYVSLINGTEATLLAGASGVFHDLVLVTGANTSTNAVLIDIRDTKASNIVLSLFIPAKDTKSMFFQAPIPQSEADSTWTVDMGDDSNTTVDIFALFIKNV